MVTVITPASKAVAFRLALLPFLVVSSAVAAKTIVSPSLSSGVYAYGIKQQPGDADRGVALEVSPGLALAYDGSWLDSSLTVASRNLAYRDEQRSGENAPSYQWTGTMMLLNDALRINTQLNQQYTQSGALQSRYQDFISAPENQVKSQSRTADLSFANSRLDWANLSLNMRYGQFESDGVSLSVLDPTQQFQLSNDTAGLGISLKSRSRASKFFYGVTGDATKTGREVLENQYNRRLSGYIGIPFFWDIGMIGVGSLESNSELTTQNNAFESYNNFKTIGGGLEWKISNDSYWDVTYNTITTDKRKKGYLGTKFELRPSVRTSLTGRLDRRFFGRSAELRGSYRTRHFRADLSASDELGSILGFGRDDFKSALFICPPGVVPGLDNCYQPPTLNYQPATGELLYNINIPNGELSELLSVRRNHMLTLGYDFSRLKLLFNTGLMRDSYIEQDSLNESVFNQLTANWQLNNRNSMTLALDYSNIKQTLAGVTQTQNDLSGISRSATLSWSREINSMLSATLNLKRIKVSYRGNVADYAENRLWLMTQFKF